MAKRDKGGFSAKAKEDFKETKAAMDAAGEAVTGLGDQARQEGKPLDRNVDPRSGGVQRLSYNYMEEALPTGWKLVRGIAVPVSTDLDATGSMHENFGIAFEAIPNVQRYLERLLERYHRQFSTGAIQDVYDQGLRGGRVDNPVLAYQKTQYEDDQRIYKQMRHFQLARNGDDSIEDHQLALWYMANRTKTDILRYGLLGYYFIISDEIGRDWVTAKDVKDVFGLDLQAARVRTGDVAQKVLEMRHTFYLQVYSHSHTTSWWGEMIGRERVVILPETRLIPEVQAVIIGLTEGTLKDLSEARTFLEEDAHLSRRETESVLSAVIDVPKLAQASRPGFNDIPKAGDVFAEERDVWPIGRQPVIRSGKPSEVKKPDDQEINWKL